MRSLDAAEHETAFHLFKRYQCGRDTVRIPTREVFATLPHAAPELCAAQGCNAGTLYNKLLSFGQEEIDNLFMEFVRRMND